VGIFQLPKLGTFGLPLTTSANLMPWRAARERRPVPVESLQHPLSVYEALLEVQA